MRTLDEAVRVRSSRADERTTLLAWLDRGLREGTPGTLEAEHPLALSKDAGDLQIVAEVRGRIASHALARAIRIEADGRRLRTGMIGLVYTDLSARHRGLASRCIDSCCEALAQQGVPLVALWSDRWRYYQKLGFDPAGTEVVYSVTREIGRRIHGRLGGIDEVGSVRPEDWSILEDLYRAKPVRVKRRNGELERLAGAPDCQLLVARVDRRPVAYASMGRGADFPGVIHEWAGCAAGVLACVAGHLRGRQSVELLAGPAEEDALQWLREVGAPGRRGCFALVRLLDAEAVWRCLSARVGGLEGMALRAATEEPRRFRFRTSSRSAVLDHAETLALLFGSRLPEPALRILDEEERRAIEAVFPWPLFVWGFDSI